MISLQTSPGSRCRGNIGAQSQTMGYCCHGPWTMTLSSSKTFSGKRTALASRPKTSPILCNAEIRTKFSPSGIAVDGRSPTSPKAWEKISTLLRDSKVKMVSVDEVERMSSGWGSNTVIDVRPVGEYDNGHVPGSTNVEFYRLIEGWDLVKIARRALFAFFGVLNGTEYNDRFLEEFQAAVPDKSKRVILVCSIGGTLEPTSPSKFGRQSRSLTAAFELINAGWKNISVLDGGFGAWKKADKSIDFNED